MNKSKLLFPFLFFASLLGCKKEHGHQFITIVNKSDFDIRVQEIWSTHLSPSDTMWNCRRPAYLAEKDSSLVYECTGIDRGKFWKNDLKSIPYIQYLIFDAKTHDSIIDFSIPCERTTYTIPVLHVYQLRLKDLEHMNWTVVYPPEKQVYYEGDINP